MNSRPAGAPGPIDYYDALYGPSSVSVPLSDGKVLVVERAGIGLHFYLQDLGRRIGTAPLDDRAGLLADWLAAAGVDAGRLALADLPAVVRAVKRLNAPRGKAAWEQFESDKAPQERMSDYHGRALARIVDQLARHYGWSIERILALPPEVALAHAQECILAEHKQRTWEHYLSDVAWEYSKADKKSHYKPLAPVPWDQPRGSFEAKTPKPVPQHIIDKYYPKGVIIDLTKRGPNERIH